MGARRFTPSISAEKQFDSPGPWVTVATPIFSLPCPKASAASTPLPSIAVGTKV